MRRKTTPEFIVQAKQLHGDTYDYCDAVYVNNKTPVKIICPEHGAFHQRAGSHLSGHGCKKCALDNPITIEETLAQFTTVHGDKYDYSRINFVDRLTKVEIVCPEHGAFWQTPADHKSGRGCMLCGRDTMKARQRASQDAIIKRFVEVHGDTYDYSQMTYTNMTVKVAIICPVHGRFHQAVAHHINGSGCPECGVIKRANTQRLSTEQVIDDFRGVHGDKYDYSLVKYDKAHDTVDIVCPDHGIFQQTAYMHKWGNGCPKCPVQQSKGELEVLAFIESLGVKVVTSDRTVLNGLEIDLYMPEHRIGVEFNGKYWHSESSRTPKARHYHREKTLLARNRGVQLIHIFDNMWNDKKPIIKSMLRHKLHKARCRIGARKCRVRRATEDERVTLLDQWHVQGAPRMHDETNILMYNGEAVAIMSHNTPRFKTDGGVELTRFACRPDTVVSGGFQKLLSHIPRPVVSFVDNTYGDGHSYAQAGFEKVADVAPGYYWWKGATVLDRFKTRRNKLPTLLGNTFDPSLSEAENMRVHGWDRYYDSGKTKYILCEARGEQ